MKVFDVFGFAPLLLTCFYSEMKALEPSASKGPETMVGHHWIPGFNTASPRTQAISPEKQESLIASGCRDNHKATGHAVTAVSTICAVILVICVALVVFYRESESKPERESILFDYQNISDHYLTATKLNSEIKNENQNLKEQNSWLEERTKYLNKSLVDLVLKNRALTSGRIHVQVRFTNLTSRYEQLLSDHERLVQYISELEENNGNMSQTISTLVNRHTELERERENISETNAFLREELLQVNEERTELVELNSKFSGEIKNLSVRIEAESLLRDQCEKSPPHEKMIAELQEQNRNLSSRLKHELRDLAERERSTGEEMRAMSVDASVVNEAYRSLDRYCPVVNQRTKERICKPCPESWTLFQTKCYYFSLRALSWSASRAWCRAQGGDLLIVNTKQEQTFTFAASRAMGQDIARLWIGMTDAEKEGHWVWVDGSPVASAPQFWLRRSRTDTEPDDWKAVNPQGEDCGHIDTHEEDITSWMDGSCDAHYRWICEKSV